MTGLGQLGSGSDLVGPSDGLVVYPNAALAVWRPIRVQVVMFTPSSAVPYFWQLDGGVSTGNATGTFYLDPDDYAIPGYSVEYHLELRQGSNGALPLTGLYQAGSMGGGAGSIVPSLGGARVENSAASGQWDFGPVAALLQIVSQVSTTHSGYVWGGMTLFVRNV